jgi:hypothetical protein
MVASDNSNFNDSNEGDDNGIDSSAHRRVVARVDAHGLAVLLPRVRAL